MKLSEVLETRGFIHQISTEKLSTIVDGKKRTIYHGIDPTADSAHAGNMAVWVLLKHLASDGHKIIFLVGGGTGMIGDPKPDSERELKSQTQVEKNVTKIKTQAEIFFGDNIIEFVNNYEWLGKLTLIEFLRDIGKHYTVNELIKKEAIATRLASDNGLSYTEFAYPLLQGYDFLELYKTKGCTVQVGGSDQWGNIISGVELVRRKEQAEAFAITVPLIVDKGTGKKFGKSEGNAVWLDPAKTSPYQFYQFWLNVSDESVVDYLKLFTFLSLEEIEVIEKEWSANPGERQAQKSLALAVTTLVHGEDQAQISSKISGLLFGDILLEDLSEEEAGVLVDNAPTFNVKIGENIVDVLVKTELAKSKREAKMFIENKAISISGSNIINLDTKLNETYFAQKLAILVRGKKQKVVLKLS
tara:strand:- start:14112 stop:15356 length:1245 start_codon:yes stop_codon:yes gene_type:complete